MPTYPVTIEGRTFDVIADTPELAAKKAYARTRAFELRGAQPRMSFEDFDAAMKHPAAPPAPQGFEQFDAAARGGAPAPAEPGGPTWGDVGGILLRNLAATPGRMAEAVGQDVHRLADVGRSLLPSPQGPSPAQTAALTTALRVAPGLVPNPLLSAPLSAAGETLAQAAEMRAGQREAFSPGQVGLSAALPIGAATAIRAARGVGRTITRTVPSLFQRAQGQAAAGMEEIVQGARPTVNPSQLYEGAEAAAGDLIPMTRTTKVAGSFRIPADPANPATEAVRKTVANLKAVAKPGGEIPLGELEGIRQDIGPLVGRSNADPKLKAIYASIIRDLEVAGQSGSEGAAMAREAATAFKQERGAGMLHDLFERASPIRAGTGEEPALNIATFKRLVRDNRGDLEKHLSPDALRVVDAFMERFRGLPPTTAYSGWNRLLVALGGAAGGAGAIVGGPGGFLAGMAPAVGLEVATNMAMAGRNPAWVNQLLTTALQTARATALAEPPTGRPIRVQPGAAPEAPMSFEQFDAAVKAPR